MTPSAFGYARPGSVDEAVARLGEGPCGQILAGGQTLIPLLAQRAVRPRLVIDINRIPDLDRIEMTPEHVRMGALVRQEQARLHLLVRDEVPGLAEALGWVASPVIRERGTVVGNLVANAPASELPAVAVALGAQFTVRDRRGERPIAAADLLRPGGGLEADAMVTHVLWPRLRGCGGFYEVARRDGHASVVGAMVTVTPDECRVGLCGVTAVGIACAAVARAIFMRFPSALDVDEIDALLERDLLERDLPERDLPERDQLDRDLPEPAFGNAFVGAEYRREVAPAVIQRAIMAAAADAPDAARASDAAHAARAGRR